MAAHFQLFRLNLVQRVQLSLFDEKEPTREEYLRRVFETASTFQHFRNEFHYIPTPKLSSSEGVFGHVGRRVVFDENLPPDQGFAETTHPGWKACVVAVDPRPHQDGQKAAIQIDQRVGSPTALFGAFARSINEGNPGAPYTIEALPLVDADDFWAFAEENEGDVTSVTFELSVPNGIWGTASAITDDLRAVRDSIRAQEVVMTFKTDGGLETKSEQIEEAVTYAQESGGKIKAKAKGGKKYNSTSAPKVTTLALKETESSTVIQAVARLLSTILGRE